MVTPGLLNVAIPEKPIKNISWVRDLHFWAHSTVPDPAAQRCAFEIIKYLAAIAAAKTTSRPHCSKWGFFSVRHHHTNGIPPKDSQSHRKHWISSRAVWEERLVLWYLQEVSSSLSHQEEWKSCLVTWGQCPMNVLILYCTVSVSRLVF